MVQIGRFFIVVGVVLVVLGVLLIYSDVFSFLKLGRLSGDITVKRDNFTFYFPLTTCILISIVLTIIFYLLRK